MNEMNRLFEKLDTTFEAQRRQDKRYRHSLFNKALILVLGISPAAAALSLFM